MFEGRRHLSRLTAAGWLGDGKFKAASLWASCPHLRSSHPVACLLLFEPQERERPERVSIGSWAVFRVKSNAGCRHFPLGTRELHPTVPGSAHPFQGLKRKGGDSVVPSRVVKAGPLTLQPVRGTRLGPPETVANERRVSLTGTFLRSSYVEDVYREKGPFRLEQEGQKEGSCVWGWGRVVILVPPAGLQAASRPRASLWQNVICPSSTELSSLEDAKHPPKGCISSPIFCFTGDGAQARHELSFILSLQPFLDLGNKSCCL